MDTATAVTVRAAGDADAGALLAIYTPFVEHTTVSFETVAPTREEFAARIRKCTAQWAWLVAECGGAIAGYASASAHRERAAYRWSVETSAYVDPRFRRRGIATTLYRELFARVTDLGYCNAFAGVALPNDASLALHRGLGFEPIGVFRRVGYKFGAWRDVAWFQRRLREEPPS